MNYKMEKTDTLAHPSNLLENIELVISDIDYTLVDTDYAHEKGILAIGEILGHDVAEEVNKLFRLTVEGHRRPLSEPWEKRSDFDTVTNLTHEVHK